MKAIDEVVRRRVAPVLEEAGFRRNRSRFWLSSPSGDLAAVSVSPFRLGEHEAEFFVDLAVSPRAHVDLVRGDADAGDVRPGLWTDRLPAPGARGLGMRHLWSFDVDDEEAGEQLTARLHTALPGVVRLMDPERLLARARDPRTPPHELPLNRDVTVALLLADQGPSSELDRLIAVLDADDLYGPLVAFLRQRAGVPKGSVG